MRTAAFIALAAICATLCSALSARLVAGHMCPDVCLIVVVFVSLRREPLAIATTALCLGYFTARQALAPTGLFESSLLLMGIGTYVSAGSLSGSGALFFALTCAVVAGVYQALVFVLLYWQLGHAGFSSPATATLVVPSLCTGLMALLLQPLLQAVDRRLTRDKRPGLAWR